MNLFVYRSRQLTITERCVFSLLAQRYRFAAKDGRWVKPLSAAKLAKALRLDRVKTLPRVLTSLQAKGLVCGACATGWRVSGLAAVAGEGWLDERGNSYSNILLKRKAGKREARCWLDRCQYDRVDIGTKQSLRQNMVQALANGRRSNRAIARMLGLGICRRTVDRIRPKVAVPVQQPVHQVPLVAKLEAKAKQLIRSEITNPKPGATDHVCQSLLSAAVAMRPAANHGKILCSIVNYVIHKCENKSDYAKADVLVHYLKHHFRETLAHIRRNKNYEAAVILEARACIERMLVENIIDPYQNVEGELSKWKYRRRKAG